MSVQFSSVSSRGSHGDRWPMHGISFPVVRNFPILCLFCFRCGISSEIRCSTQGSSTHYSPKVRRPHTLLAEYILLRSFVSNGAPTAPDPPLAERALRRRRGLPPTHRDTGFAKTAETAVSAVSKAVHDDRWRQPPLQILRGQPIDCARPATPATQKLSSLRMNIGVKRSKICAHKDLKL